MTFYLTCQFQIHINEVRVCGGLKAHVVSKNIDHPVVSCWRTEGHR